MNSSRRKEVSGSDNPDTFPDSSLYCLNQQTFSNMREGSKPIRYKDKTDTWNKNLENNYVQISNDGSDSAFLNRFPVLRYLKDNGRDARFKAYKANDTSTEGEKSSSRKSFTVGGTRLHSPSISKRL